MVQPTLKPTDSLQMLERHHHDPPALWFAVTVGSFLIHLLAFGILRLLLMGGSQDLQPRKAIVPVEVITVAPKTTSPTQIAQKPSAVTTKNPAAVNPPTRRILNPSQNPSATGANQPPTKRSSPISSQNKPPAKQIQKPTVKVSPSRKNSQSPVANSSPNQQPQPKPSSTNPVSPNKTPVPPPSASPKPSPSASPKPSPSPTTETPTGGGSISVGQLGLISNSSEVLHPGDPKYNDRLATLLEGNRQLSAEELKQLGIRLDKDLKLTVGVLVEADGTASVLSTKVLSGNIKADAAERLAKKIVQQWKFQPTLMEGKPVTRDYYLPITISPIKK